MERFRSSQGDFAACGRREGFALRGEFLSQRWERNQRIAGGRLRMSASRSYSPYPRTPFYGGRQLGALGSHRKGAGGSVDWLTFYDRCR